MTQMMLFPSEASTQRSQASVLPRIADGHHSGHETSGHHSVDVAVQRRLGAAADVAEGPAKRMGDLARLVILRYEIAAKRREQMQRRRQQTAAIAAH